MKTETLNNETGGGPVRSVLACGETSPLSDSHHEKMARWRLTRPTCITLVLLGFILLHSAFCLRALGQSYSVDWYKIASGASTSTGGTYQVSGSIGQPDASGSMTGGNYSLTGGFWSLISVALPAVGLPVQSATNLLLNGDFSLGLTNWTAVAVAGGYYSNLGYPKFPISVGDSCVPTLGNGHCLAIDVPGGADGYVEQAVTLPMADTVLSFMSWNAFESTTVTISLIDTTNGQHILDNYIPPSVLTSSGDCSGAVPLIKTYDLIAFAGQTVKVRMEATAQGNTGTKAEFADMSLVVVPHYLSVCKTSTNTVAVWWPVLAGNWQMQETTNLSGAGSGWTSCAFQTNGVNCIYIQSPPSGNRFYRLISH